MPDSITSRLCASRATSRCSRLRWRRSLRGCGRTVLMSLPFTITCSHPHTIYFHANVASRRQHATFDDGFYRSC